MKLLHPKTIFVIGLILVSAFVRLYRIGDYMEFLGDQGRDVYIVRDFLKNGNLFFIGPQTSIGNMYLGPFYYYLFVAPGLLLANFNPIGPAVVVALFGVATVYLVHLLSLRWFGLKTAVIAPTLYALSPVVIKYSNFSWNPNIMPFFALIFYYYLTEKKYIPAALAFIICLNSHFLALLLLPLGAIIWAVNYYQSTDKSPLIRQTIVAIFIFLASLTPQFLFDLKHHWQNSSAIVSFFTHRESTVNLKPYKALPEIYPLFLQVNTRLLTAKNEMVGLVISIGFLLLALYFIFLDYRRRHHLNHHLIFQLLWLSIGLVGLALYKQHIYDHYFGFIYPVVFILFGYFVSRLPHYISLLVTLGLILLSISQNPFRWSPPHQLATTREITAKIIAESSGQPFNFALLAKMNYDPGYRYFFAENKAPVALLQDKLTEQLFVVCEPFQIDCQPINNPEWGIAAFGWAKIDQQWEINGIKIFRLIHQPQK